MEEFIRENHFYLNEGVIILAALVGLIFFKKFKNTPTRYFIYFLLYVVVIELLGYYPSFSKKYQWLDWLKRLTENTVFEENYLWYAIFWQLGSAIFLSFYFNRILINENYKNVIKYSLLAFLIFAIVNSCINYHVYYNNTITSIWLLGVCQITLCVTLYFLEILGSDRIMSFYKSVEFYVAAVFFIWFLIKTPLNFYQIYYSQADWSFVFLKRDIILFANMFMYLTFTFAFIYCRPNNDI